VVRQVQAGNVTTQGHCFVCCTDVTEFIRCYLGKLVCWRPDGGFPDMGNESVTAEHVSHG
jgi:hypothetical protein